MTHPYLAFCPYLPVHDVIEFAGWELGPLEAFDGRWSAAPFEAQAKAFLKKFVDGAGAPVKNPSMLCRLGHALDGALPASNEVAALENAIAFGFLDQNPRHGPKTEHRSWAVVTADNTEVYFWPIDVEAGYVTVRTGFMVQTLGGGYQIDDRELVIRPPLDLHLPLGAQRADPMVLEAVYKTVLSSAGSPGKNATGDRIRVAIGWLAKAWRNTSTVHWSERVVFLKTAFEAMTGTDKSHISAQLLRDLFRAVPNTSPSDSELLIWSPTETPSRPRNWTDRRGVAHVDQLTDLEHWFMEFAGARNSIIHNGITPVLTYNEPHSEYNGHLVFTGEFLLRAIIKVSLGTLGYPDLWRSEIWRIVKATYESLCAQEAAEQAIADGEPTAES
jgi:hypothetical protein